MANRTTNERFSRRAPKEVHDEEDDDSDSQQTSSIMSMSDFDTTTLTESGLEKSKEGLTSKKKKPKKKRKGCCVNCWKMCSHTKVVPQKKLYNYLAERSSVLSTSDL